MVDLNGKVIADRQGFAHRLQICEFHCSGKMFFPNVAEKGTQSFS